jgi:hypothetical protein
LFIQVKAIFQLNILPSRFGLFHDSDNHLMRIFRKYREYVCK